MSRKTRNMGHRKYMALTGVGAGGGGGGDSTMDWMVAGE